MYIKYKMNTSENIFKLDKNEIFVFGSNLSGIHGSGDALLTKNKFGSIQRNGIGIQEQCYVIPTKYYKIINVAF